MSGVYTSCICNTISCLCDSTSTITYYCNYCVSATGRPGTLSNVSNSNTVDQIQRQIQHTVRVTPSEYIMNKATSTTDLSCNSNWLSDRSVLHGMDTITHTRNSSSTKHSRTALRPGVSSAPTYVKGVDVKHFSYQRYLNRLKGLGPLKPASESAVRPTAEYGGKNIAFTMMHC
jgi:hypothetical protein